MSRIAPALIAVTALAHPLHAGEAGEVDPAFGVGGRVRLAFGSAAGLSDVEVQPDGRILAVGASTTGSLAVRWLPDGTLDPSFGTGGVASLPFHGASALGLLDDGDILVAGGLFDFEVLRLFPDGTLDTSFGTAGVATIHFGQSTDTALGLTVVAGGRIVVAGVVESASSQDMALARLLPDGSLDASFGTAGKQVLAFGGPSIARALIGRPDGRLLVLGETRHGVSTDMTLASLLANGAADPAFGTGGVVFTHAGQANESARALAGVLYQDGRVAVAGGVASPTGEGARLLARYLPDGSLDPTFGAGGIVYDGMGPLFTHAWGLARQADGRLVAVGQENRGFNRRWLLERFEANGRPDSTFGEGGRVTEAWGAGWNTAHDVAPQADGKLVVVGTIKIPGRVVCSAARYLRADSIGAGYCVAVPSSTGGAATLRASGSTQLTDDDVLLIGDALPTHRTAILLMSQTRDFVPMLGGGQGNLCLGTPHWRLVGVPLDSGPAGQVVRALRRTDAPASLPFVPGQSWNFQLWFRDQNPGPTSNTSAALELTWN